MTHGVVSIELLVDGGRISINKELVKQRLAVPAEESYDSKVHIIYSAPWNIASRQYKTNTEDIY